MCLRVNLKTKHTINEMFTALKYLILGHRLYLQKRNFGGKNCFLFPFLEILKVSIILTEGITLLKVS
jgi:hypothetical protein